MAEAKGAVELLLADCYVRRDRVALIAFRGTDAELLLPPTRSLARARRSLAGLPGMSVPAGFGAHGMPVGLQLIGNYFQEARLLNVAHRLQQATDFHLQKPAGAQ